MKPENEGDYVTVVTFKLQGETFALEADLVREILDPVHVTRVPHAPEFVSGLINVRGMIVPLADLRVVFGMARPPADEDTRIIVIEFDLDGETVMAGILADKVNHVTDLPRGSLDNVPPVGMKWSPEFIRNIGQYDGGFVILPELRTIFQIECGWQAAAE